LPEDKGDIIEQLQEQGHVVAFVGDGVNDAPALVKADVGVSMPGSADLAKESAHVVLLNEDLTSLAFSREVSQKVMSVIRKNFYMTLSINSFALLLAVFGFVSPLTAALIHNCSTIGLLGYALKATSIKPRI
jgi:Cu2+-exporting ATPase